VRIAVTDLLDSVAERNVPLPEKSSSRGFWSDGPARRLDRIFGDWSRAGALR
jgi:hypothetical protein